MEIGRRLEGREIKPGGGHNGGGSTSTAAARRGQNWDGQIPATQREKPVPVWHKRDITVARGQETPQQAARTGGKIVARLNSECLQGKVREYRGDNVQLGILGRGDLAWISLLHSDLVDLLIVPGPDH